MKRLLQIYPEWIYNALSYLYLAAGLLAMYLLDSVVGFVSGLLLALAGAAVWILRFRYRREFAQYQRDMDLETKINRSQLPEGGLLQISWSKAYECGHPVIDGQHRRLFSLANEAIVVLLTQQPKEKEEALLDKLLAHMTEHFATEEGILAETADPGLAQHELQHQNLMARACQMRERYHQGDAVARDLLAFLEKDVITDHILREDCKWARKHAALGAQRSN